MGGFIDPFLPSLAWPQDNAFTGSSWTDTSAFPLDPSLADSSGTYKGTAPAEDVQFHGQNGSSPVLMNGGSKQVMDKSLFPGETMSPVKLHEQVLRQDDRTQDLNFELDSAIECALMAGSLGPTLSTSCPISLTESPLVLCTSNESSGSDQFLMGEQSISSASAMWPSTYANIPSLVGEQTSQTFSFGRIPGDDLLNEACTPNVKKYPQIGSVPSASLPLHDDTEFNTSQPLSFAPGQQMTLNNADFHINQKEFSGLHHLDLSSLVSSFNGIGTAQNPKQCTEATSGRHDMISLFGTPPEVQNGDGTGGNGATKPRVRARRGQATDPHSIAERLRREKISDRMKNLQELVPNSNKTDKASMLDEIIEYVKFLQLQVKVLSMSRLGATEAVVPLLTESPNESCGLLISPRSGRQTGGLTQTDLQDSSAFEQEVVQLMENNMTTAMEYLQSKGLCLMPIALATAISNQKGTSSAAIPPKSGTGAQPETGAAEEGITGCSKADVKKVDALKPLNSPRETKSRA